MKGIVQAIGAVGVAIAAMVITVAVFGAAAWLIAGVFPGYLGIIVALGLMVVVGNWLVKHYGT